MVGTGERRYSSLTNEKTKHQEKLTVQIYTARNRKWLIHVGPKYSSTQNQ